jgi:hypothetical protein
MTLKNKLMTTADSARHSMCSIYSQAQDFEPQNQKELSGLCSMNKNETKNMIEIHSILSHDDGVELAPGRYIKTEWYASNLYFQEGSDVFFVASKRRPPSAAVTIIIYHRWTISNKGCNYSERSSIYLKL